MIGRRDVIVNSPRSEAGRAVDDLSLNQPYLAFIPVTW